MATGHPVRPTSWTVLLGLLGACSPQVPLGSVPVMGGSAEQRQVVRDGLAEFDAWIGPGRLRLASVEITSLPDDWVGDFRRPSFRIRLQRSWPELREALRHELCHALDYEEDLVERPSPLFDGLADGLLAPNADVFVAEPTVAHQSRRRQRSEALASFCEMGPVVATMIARPCEGEAPLGAEVGHWLLDHVWHGFDAVHALPAGVPVTWDAGSPPGDMFRVSPSAEPGVVVVNYDHFVELYSGDELDEADCCGETSNEAPGGGPEGVTLYRRVGWPDGPAGGVGDVHLHHLGLSRGRQFRYHEGDWRLVEGSCVPSGVDLFTAGSEVWIAWPESSTVNWTPIGR